MRLKHQQDIRRIGIGSGTIVLALALLLSGVPITTQAAPAITVDQEEWAFLPLINDFRVRNGLSKLQMSVPLTAASDWMSNDMAVNNSFSHTDSQGRSMKDRINSFGYTGTMGENIAAGQPTAKEVFLAWENSPGHRANMLNPSYRVIGIGRVVKSGSTYGTYWTTDFGATVGATIAPSATPVATSTIKPIATAQKTKKASRRLARKLRFSHSKWAHLFRG